MELYVYCVVDEHHVDPDSTSLADAYLDPTVSFDTDPIQIWIHHSAATTELKNNVTK